VSARAGLARVELSTAAGGAALMGYADRDGPALAVHDPLYARALVLESNGRRIALCSVDVCAVNEDVVAAARTRIADATPIRGGDVFVCATHTHSGPLDDDPGCWPAGLDERIADAVTQASARLVTARVGAGWGQLHGHTLNRRRLEDPVDPAVLVVRVDDGEGRPLGIGYGFACHPVVLGPDSRVVSADWPGTAGRILEQELGPETMALFVQGACADVNPLTDGLRRGLADGRTVRGQLEGLAYYGRAGRELGELDVGDRRGGTFAEAEQLGRAVAEEVLRVHRGVACADVRRVWTRSIAVEPTGAPAYELGPLGGHGVPRAPADAPLEVMLAGVDGPGVVLLGQPGEVFAETGFELRRLLREVGARHPFVVGYANGWRAYLAPSSAYPDGGYEVDWARAMRLPEHLQDDIRARALAAVRAAT
jgi:Neutral/alkaline non-lysosomal ceramidase, N-terminal